MDLMCIWQYQYEGVCSTSGMAQGQPSVSLDGQQSWQNSMRDCESRVAVLCWDGLMLFQSTVLC